MPELVARAPTRIDFGGGWTDVPPYPAEQGGCVCNLAIARYATVRVRRPDPASDAADAAAGPGATAEPIVAAAARRAGVAGARATLTSDFPVGAGLGGSSAAGVATVGALAALRGVAYERAELAERSRALEVEDLGVAGGRQDHYAAAFGGALGLWFADRVDVRRIALAPARAAALARRCVVAYTGQSRISGETITAVLDAYRTRVPRVVDALARMKALAEQMVAALEASDLDALGALVGEHWTHQRALHPAITTPRIDAILARADAAGALGAKALGASGGGCVVVVAPEDGAERVRAAVAELAEVLEFGVDTGGFEVRDGGTEG